MEEKKEVVIESNTQTKSELEARYHTSEINHLAKALAQAQGSYKKLIPNQRYKDELFANMDAIRDATREALATNGLSFIQRDEILNDGSGMIIFKSMLLHESGQWISSWARIVPDRTLKETMVMYETTARLHATKLLGIAPSVNDPYLFDDNGEYESERTLINDLQKPQEDLEKERKGKRKTIDAHQYRQLEFEIGTDKALYEQIIRKHNISSIADLPLDVYPHTISWVRNKKREAENELAKRR